MLGELLLCTVNIVKMKPLGVGILVNAATFIIMFAQTSSAESTRINSGPTDEFRIEGSVTLEDGTRYEGEIVHDAFNPWTRAALWGFGTLTAFGDPASAIAGAMTVGGSVIWDRLQPLRIEPGPKGVSFSGTLYPARDLSPQARFLVDQGEAIIYRDGLGYRVRAIRLDLHLGKGFLDRFWPTMPAIYYSSLLHGTGEFQVKPNTAYADYPATTETLDLKEIVVPSLPRRCLSFFRQLVLPY